MNEQEVHIAPKHRIASRETAAVFRQHGEKKVLNLFPLLAVEVNDALFLRLLYLVYRRKLQKGESVLAGDDILPDELRMKTYVDIIEVFVRCEGMFAPVIDKQKVAAIYRDRLIVDVLDALSRKDINDLDEVMRVRIDAPLFLRTKDGERQLVPDDLVAFIFPHRKDPFLPK